MTNAFDTAETPVVPTPVADTSGIDKRLKDKDDFIATLKAELETARAEAANADLTQNTLEELRAEFRKLKAQPATVQENTTSKPDANEIRSVVLESIEELDVARTRKVNQATANEMLVKKYGDTSKAKEAVTQLAKSLGFTVEDLANIAARSPAAFAKMAGLDEVKVTPALDTTRSALNTAVNHDSGELKPGTRPYYDNLRRTDPKRYWSQAMQVEIHKAAMAGTYQL